MMADNLSNKQFEAKDINELLRIDRNRLFYWINTHRLLKPEIREAGGIGRRAVFSLRNLLELETIKRLEIFGFDLSRIREIKSKLDKFNPEKKRRFNIFRKAFDEEYLRRETAIYIYKKEKDFVLFLHTVKKGKDYWAPSDPFRLDEESDMDSVMRLDIGKMAMRLKKEVEKKERRA